MRVLLLVIAALTLAACGGGGSGGGGGGGGGGGPTTNQPPVAVAGTAQAGVIGQLLTFNGAGSFDPEGAGLTFTWTLTSAPAGNTAALSGAATPVPTLRPNVAGTYTLSLVVRDGAQNSAPSTTTATVTVDATDLGRQQSAQLMATIDNNVQIVTLDWRDSFPAGASYRIEKQTGGGAFVVQQTVAGVGGSNAAISWQQPYSGTATFRIIALTGGKELPLLSPTGLIALTATLPASLAILNTGTEPLSGSSQLSVDQAPAGSTTTWSIDGTQVGTGNPFSWNTTVVPNTSHLVAARLAIGGDVFITLSRNITTLNSNLTVSAFSDHSATVLRVIVTATSQLSLPSVQVAIDGGAFQTLTAPNVCMGFGSQCNLPHVQGFWRYQFNFPIPPITSGPHTATVRATDTAGTTQITIPANVSSAPVLTLTSPVAGAIVSGTLAIAGSYTTDSGSPVTVTASLGASQVMQTTATPFSSNVNITNTPPGQYTLTVVATDAFARTTTIQRPVVVSASAPTALFTTLENYVINAAEGDIVLYTGVGAPNLIRNVTGGAEVTLEDVSSATSFQITPDWIYASGRRASDAACASPARCIYRFSTTTGAATSLSAADPAFAPGAVVNRSNLQRSGSHLVWLGVSSGVSRFTVYNTQTGVYTVITPPAGFDIVGSDMTEVSGSPLLYFWARRVVSGTGVATTYESVLHRWTPASGITQALALPIGTRRGESVSTDGVTLAYATAISVQVPNPPGAPLTVSRWTPTVTPVAGGATTELANDIDFGILLMRNGIARFDSNRVWSPSQGSVTLFAPGAAFSVYLGSGFYSYFNAGAESVWNGATGVSTQKITGGPFRVFITGNWLYFKSGVGVYRVPLN